MCVCGHLYGRRRGVCRGSGAVDRSRSGRAVKREPACALRAEVDLARADALVAGRVPNPRLTVSREAAAGVTESFLLVSQSLPITGRRGMQIDSAAERVRASELRADDMQRRLRAEVRRAFVDLSVLEGRERELNSALQSLQSLAETLSRREKAGDAAGFDRLRAERGRWTSPPRWRGPRRRAWPGALASFFFPDSPRPRGAASAEQPPLPSADDLRPGRKGTARSGAMDRDIEAARLAGRAAGRSVVPETEIVGGLKTSGAVDDRYGSVLSVVASIPLFDRARPEKAQAAARELLATAERDRLRAEIASAVRGLRLSAQERRGTAESYRREAVPRSDELRRIAQVSYDAGERGILELLDAYRSAAPPARLWLGRRRRRADIDLEPRPPWRYANEPDTKNAQRGRQSRRGVPAVGRRLRTKHRRASGSRAADPQREPLDRRHRAVHGAPAPRLKDRVHVPNPSTAATLPVNEGRPSIELRARRQDDRLAGFRSTAAGAFRVTRYHNRNYTSGVRLQGPRSRLRAGIGDGHRYRRRQAGR
jgi:cobalt-zinc-cadmium efflux system outer membrane protein